MTDVDVKLYTAIISAVVSLIIAVITYVSARKTQVKIEELKVELLEKKAENDARRDYEYEARKRLYQECEPLLFQLYETSENALHRIRSLARTARQGNLWESNHWLDHSGYYMASTIYNLLAPVAVYKLLQRRITFVDLSVEPQIKAQYHLAKAIYISFTDDFDFAKVKPVLSYDPNHADWHNLRKINPMTYWRQGCPAGRLDTAVEAMIIRDPTGQARLRSFGEFESEYFNAESAIGESFSGLTDVFLSFHPLSRPILWRMLITQAHIYKALLRGNRSGPINKITEDKRKEFDWREEGTESSKEQAVEEPFSASEEYLKMRLGTQFNG